MDLGLSFNVTLEGILAVIEKINQRRNKDKNEVCLALQLIDFFIFQWHKDFVTIFKKATGLEGKILDKNDKTFQTIFAFTHRIDYRRLANEYNSYLVDVLYQGYYAPGNFKFTDIIDQMGGIGNVSALATNIGLFADRAYGSKMDWLNKGMEEERWTISTAEISTTLHELASFSEEVRKLTSKMRHNLRCPTGINEQLYRELSQK